MTNVIYSGSSERGRCRRGRSEIPHSSTKLQLLAPVLEPSTAQLRIRTLQICGFRGPGLRSARQVLCGGRVTPFSRSLCYASKQCSGADRALSRGPESQAPKKPKSSATKTTTFPLLDFSSAKLISNCRYRIVLPEEIISNTETDLWEFQQTISQYIYRFSLEFQFISITDADFGPETN